MAREANFDLQAVHHYFAAECFNRAWDYIEKSERSPEEADKMVLLGSASLWHWQQREDCTPANLSVGYWQMSRIYALRGELQAARNYSQKCLDICLSENLPPFNLGYAYEALARVSELANEQDHALQYLKLGEQAANQVTDEKDRQLLLNDLRSIGGEE